MAQQHAVLSVKTMSRTAPAPAIVRIKEGRPEDSEGWDRKDEPVVDEVMRVCEQ